MQSLTSSLFPARILGHIQTDHQTLLLKANINDQLNRLLTQLEDLEELRDEFTDEEYEQEKAETLAQLREFQAFLDRAVSGNLTLVDEFGAAQLAIQAAISQAFNTPEVIRLFATRNTNELRRKLAQLKADLENNIISRDMFNRQAMDVLTALKRMNEPISEADEQFLASMGGARMLEGVAVGGADSSEIIAAASKGIRSAEGRQ